VFLSAVQVQLHGLVRQPGFLQDIPDGAVIREDTAQTIIKPGLPAIHNLPKSLWIAVLAT
jgi:hypothetical protein